MRHKLPSLLAVVGLVLFSSPSAFSKTAEYSFKVLPSLGNGYLNWPVLGGNNWVAGTSLNADGVSTATVWKHGSPVSYGLEGTDFSRAGGLNAKGDVVGFASTGGQWQAVSWTKKGARALPALSGQPNSVAIAVNASGQIAGFSGSHAVMWSGDSVIDLAAYGTPYAINSAGTVVGYAGGGAAVRAVQWTDGQTLYLEGLMASTLSWATGVNDAGQVVGCSNDESAGSMFAVRWDAGVVSKLATLGSGAGCANSINQAGTIVGSSGQVAARWTGGVVVDLNQVLPKSVAQQGWRLTEATSINDTGRIAGKATNLNTGELVFFLLTPKP